MFHLDLDNLFQYMVMKILYDANEYIYSIRREKWSVRTNNSDTL